MLRRTREELARLLDEVPASEAAVWPACGPVQTVPIRVPNGVPNPADLTAPYPTEPDEASLNAAEDERQRANHNPRVGGSSPSSGIEEAP
jgi:hypothetical protein